MRKAADQMRWKIRDLRTELHAKSARFLVDNFDIILIPTFETSQMAKRESRKLRSKIVRAMLNGDISSLRMVSRMWPSKPIKQSLKYEKITPAKRVAGRVK